MNDLSKIPEVVPVSKNEHTKARVYKSAGWKIMRDGNVVRAENLRMNYCCMIGDIYKPRNPSPGEGPKKLLDASYVGGKWRAVVQAVDDNNRDRSMLLETFLSRYVGGTKKTPIPVPVKLKVNNDIGLSMSETMRVARVLIRIEEAARGSAFTHGRMEQDIERIEKKLDALLSNLGIIV